MKRVLTKTTRFLVPLLAALAMPSASSLAWCWPSDYFVDGHTRYMWSRTWHGPNALATPLRQYYIPRTRGQCDSDGYTGGSECQSDGAAGLASRYGGLSYPDAAVAGFEPMQFERLGRVPNELDLLNGVTPTGGAPAPRK